MPKPCLFALATLIATAPSHATNGAAQQIIERLDLTSFSNSVGPRRIPGKTSFADYGFTTVEEGVDGATLKQADGGWEMAFEILATTPGTVDICFHDRGIQRPGDIIGPSYNATQALRVTMSQGAGWPARQIREGLPGCRKSPPGS